ncbi:hypothetical protein DTO217A2_3426 [Paecilomyces variotii]|nr:hypothetical protein DTO217A2_3426 [Paecilomyces variotii]KAJ9348181.1 hypothetical protein DTO027B9_8480 [Paecilomyces variotii]
MLRRKPHPRAPTLRRRLERGEHSNGNFGTGFVNEGRTKVKTQANWTDIASHLPPTGTNVSGNGSGRPSAAEEGDVQPWIGVKEDSWVVTKVWNVHGTENTREEGIAYQPLLTAALSRSFWDTIHPDSPIRLHRPQLARLAFFRLDRWHLLSLLIPQPESDRRLVGACPLNGALTHGHLALFSPLFPPLTHTIPSSTPLRRRLSPQDSSPSLEHCRPLSPDKDLSQILQYQNHQEIP